MKRFLGALFMAAGAGCVYLFATSGMFHGRELFTSTFDRNLPFAVLGKNYPTDVLFMLGSMWLLLLGFVFVVTDFGRSAVAAGATGVAARFASPRKGGRIARMMLLNALLLVSSLFVAYVGGKTGQSVTTIAIFSTVALLQIAAGLVLLVLALFERPKGVISLFLGFAVYAFGVAVGVLAFLWGA